MIWGYASEQINEDGLLELKEVTFDGSSPQFLRAVAQFLTETAKKIESGTMAHDHVHIGETNAEWNEKYPKKDIIVSLPVNWDELREQIEEKRRLSPDAGAFRLDFRWPPTEEEKG